MPDPVDAFYEWFETDQITTTATDEIDRIHDRTPMAVSADNRAQWLEPNAKETDALRPLMTPPAGLEIMPRRRPSTTCAATTGLIWLSTGQGEPDQLPWATRWKPSQWYHSLRPTTTPRSADHFCRSQG